MLLLSVRQVMEVELALAAVFEKPVLSALAEWILELRLARFDPETLARLAQLVGQPGAEAVPPWRSRAENVHPARPAMSAPPSGEVQRHLRSYPRYPAVVLEHAEPFDR